MAKAATDEIILCTTRGDDSSSCVKLISKTQGTKRRNKNESEMFTVQL